MKKSALKKAVATKMRIDSSLFKQHKLHSGSKRGPIVTNPAQMRAIAYSQARKLAGKRGKK